MSDIALVPLRRLVASLDNGVWGEEAEMDGTDVQCIRAADFNFSALKATTERAPFRAIPPASWRRLRLRRGDIVVEKSGGGDGQPVGRAVLFDLEVPAVCSNFAARLRPQPGVDPRFLTYALASAYWRGVTERCIKQTTGIQNLDTGEWLRTLTPNPPTAEQRRIADFLEEQVARIDAAIAVRTHQVNVLSEQLTSRAHAEVTGTALGTQTPSRLEWAPTLPAGWPSVRLATVAKMGTGHTPSRSEPDYWIHCNIPWVTTGDVSRLRFDELDTLEETAIQISEIGLANSAAVLHPVGTVVLSRTASPGYSAVMEVPMATSQDFVVWTPTARLDPHYLLWCLRAMRRDLLGRLAMGSTHKTIYFPDLEGLRIPLPPLREQREVVRRIRAGVQSTIGARTAVRHSIGLLEERKRALIAAAVTGELDVSTAGPWAAAVTA